jgi:hypothetical protein
MDTIGGGEVSLGDLADLTVTNDNDLSCDVSLGVGATFVGSHAHCQPLPSSVTCRLCEIIPSLQGGCVRSLCLTEECKAEGGRTRLWSLRCRVCKNWELVSQSCAGCLQPVTLPSWQFGMWEDGFNPEIPLSSVCWKWGI